MLSTKKNKVVDRLKAIYFVLHKGLRQKRCLFCDEAAVSDQLSGHESPVCRPCQHDLPWNKYSCSRCALPMNKALSAPTPSNTILCGECISSPPPFNRAIASFRYELPVDRAIQILKYNKKRYFAHLFGEFLAENARQAYADKAFPAMLIPVPMHRKKQKKRGFNQALLLSQQLSKSLSIPTHAKLLQKNSATNSQATLNKHQRMQNLKGAFTISRPVKGLYIALVDDVMTTRATADYLSRLLIDAGAAKVDVWCVARTAKFRK